MNRTDTLERHLREMLEDARRLGVPIFISDDSSDDRETEARVTALAALYPGIHYRWNNPSAGHDRNLMSTLAWAAMSGAEHVWLLSDSLRILPGMLERIVRDLGEEDFLFLNATMSDAAAAEVRPERGREQLPALIWNLALTGATIYHRRVLDWVAEARPTVHRNFPQLSIILGYASAHREMRFTWVSDRIMQSAPKKS